MTTLVTRLLDFTRRLRKKSKKKDKEPISLFDNVSIGFDLASLSDDFFSHTSDWMQEYMQNPVDYRLTIEPQGHHHSINYHYDTINALSYGFITIQPKQKLHILDKLYPHVCHKCKRKIFWNELLLANLSFSHQKQSFETFNKYKLLKKLWKMEFVEFKCCMCFNNNQHYIWMDIVRDREIQT